MMQLIASARTTAMGASAIDYGLRVGERYDAGRMVEEPGAGTYVALMVGAEWRWAPLALMDEAPAQAGRSDGER